MLDPVTMEAWLSLYAGVGILAALCAVGATTLFVHQLHTRTFHLSLASTADFALALPRLWWRWQKNYLLGAPVILFVALYYAWFTGFHAFVPNG